MMDRRRFLSLLGLSGAAVATKSYFFFGGILRPTSPRMLTIADIMTFGYVDGAWINIAELINAPTDIFEDLDLSLNKENECLK